MSDQDNNKTAVGYRALLADGLSLGNGVSGVVGVSIMLTWRDPRALMAACLFVFIAWGFDSVDGLAARGLDRAPAEGAVLDSLCDISSFAALPSALLAAYGGRGPGYMPFLSSLIGVVFFSCAVLRLRRYTVGAVGHASAERTSFTGVPSPVAAMSVSASIVAALTGPAVLSWLPLLFALVTAPLMMSRIEYRDTPRIAGWIVRAKWPLPVLALIGYAARNAAVALSVFFAAYLASGALSVRDSRKRADSI